MGGKRRNTVKTGDKAISRGSTRQKKKNDDDDDPMYDAVDRFHNDKDKDFMKLQSSRDSADEEEEDEKEAVMDLGMGGGDDSASSDDDDDDDDSEEDDKEDRPDPEMQSLDDDEEEEGFSDDSDKDDNEFEMENVRDWGGKKTAYYHGDTADLELGQDEEDAFLEEEAAKEVQKARYEDMSEDDFVLSDDDGDDKKSKDDGVIQDMSSTTRDISKLSAKDRQKILDKQHPEMLPLLSHFSRVVEELQDSTNVATNALFEGEEGTAEAVGTTKPGKRYLLTKALLQTSTALNLAMYLLLKGDQPSEDVDSSLIQSHPVMARLQKLNALLQKLDERVESQVPGLSTQLTNLVKAAALVKTDEVDESDSDGEESEQDKIDNVSDEMDVRNDEKGMPVHQSSDDDDDGDEDDHESDAAAEEQRVITEARFGLRAGEISARSGSKSRHRRPMPSDFGDDDVANDQDLAQKASRSLASTLNTIEQKTNSSKKRGAPMADVIDDAEESDGELRAGLSMMEEELGKDFDKDENDGSAKYDAEVDDEDNDDDGFYAQVSQKSKSRKDFKKNLYAVAPKFPRMEPVVEGERALSKTILKNRGLVAHKPKLNRNPRVKKREQYRKAVIRRKGAVREVRKDEGHKYGGEETGIKRGISRSRKLARV